MNNLQIATNPEVDQKLAGSARDLIAQAHSFNIATDTDYENSLDLIKRLDSHFDRVEDERKSIVKPINDSVKNINSKFKAITEPLAAAKEVVKRKALSYHQLREAIRKEKEEAERKEAEKRAKEEREAAAAKEAAEKTETASSGEVSQGVDRSLPPKDDHVLDIQDLQIPAPTNTKPSVRTESGTLGTVKKVWKYRLLDIKLLANSNPAAVEVNHKGVMYCIEQGIRHMPGLEIYQEESLSVR